MIQIDYAHKEQTEDMKLIVRFFVARVRPPSEEHTEDSNVIVSFFVVPARRHHHSNKQKIAI